MKTLSSDEVLAGLESYQIVDLRNFETATAGFLSGSLLFVEPDSDQDFPEEFIIPDKPWLFISDDFSKIPLHWPYPSNSARAAFPENIPASATDLIICVDPDEFSIDYRFDEFYLIDLSDPAAFDAEHLEDAENLPFDELPTEVAELEPEMRIYLTGANSFQRFLAASFLKRNGIPHVRVVAAENHELMNKGLTFVGNNPPKVSKK